MKSSVTIIGSAALFVVLSSSAAAGIPVIDAASIAQAIKQVDAWKTQGTQMVSQLNQLQTTYQSMTGNRGMATVLNGARSTLPPDLNQALFFRARLSFLLFWSTQSGSLSHC